MRTSVIIPSRNERFLPQTIADIYAKFTGEFEVIAFLDGYWPDPPLMERPNLHILHVAPARGMRNAINSAAAIAKGEYLMKCDAHCMFAQCFDEDILKDIEDDWIVIPRRKRLDGENWKVRDVGKADIDLHYLSSPLTNKDGFSMHGCIWPQRDRERLDVLIDETPSFQGSFWLMSRRHWDWLGGMSEEGYGGFTQEPQEIGMKTWLGGGEGDGQQEDLVRAPAQGPAVWARLQPEQVRGLKGPRVQRPLLDEQQMGSPSARHGVVPGSLQPHADLGGGLAGKMGAT